MKSIKDQITNSKHTSLESICIFNTSTVHNVMMMHRLRPHHRPIIQRRYLSGGGFQGPTSRGMGRDGGGRGTGGKHREPRGGSASAGRGSGGGRGDGAGDGG